MHVVEKGYFHPWDFVLTVFPNAPQTSLRSAIQMKELQGLTVQKG